MRLESITLENFRCYKNPITVVFEDLTTFVGKNDIGKSTILEALEVFFNNDLVKIECGDAHIYSPTQKVSITCEFSQLPSVLILDSGAETSLADEYLLTQTGTLRVKKTYDCSRKNPSCDVSIIAFHPTHPGVANLLDWKEKELQSAVREQKLEVPLKGNPRMRKALWANAADLACQEVELVMTKSKEDGKRIFDQIEQHLPLFALFQSDRSSRDSDDEVQNPMKVAVAAALASVQPQIEEIQKTIQQKALEIAVQTHKALATLAPSIAKELTPHFTPPTMAKWVGLFNLGLDTDDGIPLNKRGSGVRRLVLVSFFKAEAERRLAEHQSRGIIYAIEEPETAQHPNNQRLLIEAFKSLSSSQNCQVILTTHSPGFASELPVAGIRYISRDVNDRPQIEDGADVFASVAAALGVVPDNRVEVLLCVEGPNDVAALKSLSKALHNSDQTIPDLSSDERIAFVPLGGGTLKQWVAERYLKSLQRPEVHIYDSDVPDYAEAVQRVNARQDRSWAVQTKKYEIENYLHSDAILAAFEVQVTVPDHVDEHGDAVPRIFSKALHAGSPFGAPIKDSKAKQRLAEKAFPLMTAEMLRERDPEGEVEGWLRRLSALFRANSVQLV